jgi:L-fuconolactonase
MDGPHSGQKLRKAPMRIDSHQHFWQIGRHGHEWPTPDLAPIYRDFSVNDLAQQSLSVNLSGSVVVQSQPSDADTDWLLQHASQHSLVKGVVGWVDLESSDAISRLQYLAAQPKFKGVRPMLQSLPDDHWIVRDSVQPAMREMVRLNLCFDALVFTRHLANISKIALRYPAMKIVIDHAAKPPIAARDTLATQQWRDAITMIARHGNVYCKLSGLFTEMAVDQPRDEAIPYVEHVFDVFGVGRVMWGSDWPVVLLRESYAGWYEWIQHFISKFSASQRQRILHDNACQFYGL